MGRWRDLMFGGRGRKSAGPLGLPMHACRLGWIAAREFRQAHCFERAGTLAFALLISLIPLTVLLLGIAVQFGIGDRFIQYAREELFPLLAPAFQEELARWLETSISRDAFARGMVGVVGLGVLASLVMTALGVLSTAERNFNRLWKVERSRSYAQRLATFWIVLTASPFLFIALVDIQPLLAPQGGWIERFMQASLVLKAVYSFLVPVVVGFAGFTVLYRYLPATRVKLRSAMFAGVIAAVLWELAKQAFYFYMGRASAVTSLYGSLAMLPLFLVWLYLNCVILLWGCTLSYAHQNYEVLALALEHQGVSQHLPERFLALYLLERLGGAFQQGQQGPVLLAMAEDLRVDASRVEEVARRLCDLDVLVPDPRAQGAFLLARAPAKIDLLSAVAPFRGDELPAWAFQPDAAPGLQGANALRLFGAAADAFGLVLRGKSLADLLAASSLEQR